MDGRLIDVIAREEKILKYLDIPLQHCNDLAAGGEVNPPVDIRALRPAPAHVGHGLSVEALAEDLHHIDVIAREEKILKYLDIPLQHCNDGILRKMNRRGRSARSRASASTLSMGRLRYLPRSLGMMQKAHQLSHPSAIRR